MTRPILTAGLAAAIAMLITATPPAAASSSRSLAPSRALAYWTPERMRAAEALSAADAPAARPRKPWHEFPGRATLVDWDNLGVRTIGRLYSTRPDRSPWVCSATLVESANASLVWTAGHCVHSGRGGGYHTNVVFVPGSRPGATPQEQAPYGVWPAVQVATTASWIRTGDKRHFRRDFGAAVIAKDVAGRTIQQALGAAHRISFKRKPPRLVTPFGYPGAGRFEGNLALWRCNRRGVGRYRRIRGGGPKVLITRCEMTAGSSGGPWLVGTGPDGLGTVATVTSAGTPEERTLFAPVQERVARALFQLMEKVPV